MRHSLSNLKPFKATGSNLLQNFEARLGSIFSVGGPHHRLRPKRIKNSKPQVLDSTSIALCAGPVKVPTVADRVTIVYTQQIKKAEEKKRSIKRAELALMKQMTMKSSTENKRTWEDLRREGYPIEKFVEEMGGEFVNKELRVVSDASPYYQSLGTRGGSNIESLRIVDNAELQIQRQRVQEVEAQLAASLLSHPPNENIILDREVTPIETSQQNSAASFKNRSRVLTKVRFPKTSSGVFSDSDEEMVSTLSLIGRLPTIPIANHPVPAGTLLEHVVDPSIVITVKDTQKSQMKAAERRRQKMVKALEGKSAKQIAKALASLSKPEFDRISKLLKSKVTENKSGEERRKKNK